MNDPAEAGAWAFGGKNLPYRGLSTKKSDDKNFISNQFKLGKKLKNKFQAICFSGAKKNGWDNEMMWAVYGDKHSGVCLEFDEDELVDTIRSAFPNTFFHFEEISYQKERKKPQIHWQNTLSYNENIDTILRKIAPDVALTKSICWEREDEKRLLFLNVDEKHLFIPINSSLKAIYLGTKFRYDNNINRINSLLSNTNISLYDVVYQRYKFERQQRDKNSILLPILRKYPG